MNQDGLMSEALKMRNLLCDVAACSAPAGAIAACSSLLRLQSSASSADDGMPATQVGGVARRSPLRSSSRVRDSAGRFRDSEGLADTAEGVDGSCSARIAKLRARDVEREMVELGEEHAPLYMASLSENVFSGVAGAPLQPRC
jgi:hypothetical protein